MHYVFYYASLSRQEDPVDGISHVGTPGVTNRCFFIGASCERIARRYLAMMRTTSDGAQPVCLAIALATAVCP